MASSESTQGPIMGATPEELQRRQTDSPASQDAEMEKLGKQRPEVFTSTLMEVGFCAAILGSNILAEMLISGFNVLLPSLIDDLSIAPSQRTWPANVFSLVTGAFLLPMGRLADTYGGRPVFIAGLAWLCVWALVGGFSRSYVMLVVTRALQGLGAAAFLPASITVLGQTYRRPGPRKNLVFSLYGGGAPFGFFSGILLAGVCGQYLFWGWWFWIGCILLFILAVVSVLCVPVARAEDEVGKQKSVMDWWGCATSIPALILLVYAITDSAQVAGGWRSPQIIVPFVFGIILLASFVYVEARVAEAPLFPASILKVRYMGLLFLCLFLAYGAFGIYLFYASFYIETVLHTPPLLAALWFAPLAAGGMTIALIGGLTLHKLPGAALLLLASGGLVVCNLLFTLLPENPNYWAWIMPAMVCATIGVDILYNVSSVFITTSVAKHEQGLAGACVNGLVFLGMSFFLGWADLAAASKESTGLKASYTVALFLGVGCAGAAMLIVLAGIRIGKATSDLTLEEKAEAERSVETGRRGSRSRGQDPV